MDGIEIVEAGLERLDEIEPLWTSLSEHHAELTPVELPIRSPAEGWPIRRRIYGEGLEDGAVLFFAQREGRPVGFAFAHPRPAPTNVAIDRVLDVETVAVLPEERGAGIGSALMATVERWADARGFELLQVSVRNANEGAWRLYERRGFSPLYTTMVLRRDRGSVGVHPADRERLEETLIRRVQADDRVVSRATRPPAPVLRPEVAAVEVGRPDGVSDHENAKHGCQHEPCPAASTEQVAPDEHRQDRRDREREPGMRRVDRVAVADQRPRFRRFGPEGSEKQAVCTKAADARATMATT